MNCNLNNWNDRRTTPDKPKTVKKVLTNSRIDECFVLYSILRDLYEENNTDELEYDYLFKEIMKRGLGRFNPNFVKEELNKI